MKNLMVVVDGGGVRIIFSEATSVEQLIGDANGGSGGRSTSPWGGNGGNGTSIVGTVITGDYIQLK